MRFFNKFIFICNICFLIGIILRLVEISRKKQGLSETVIPLPALQGSLVVLGEIAIVFNLIFCIALLVRIIAGKGWVLPKWIALFNIILLFVQVWYFFFAKF
jgi:hypothetical protein